jgi:predicted lactoylglutathione lyase
MSRMIFVNLPVTDLAATERFYTALGFTKNETFSDETATGLELSDTIWVMALTRDKFAEFLSGSTQVADPKAVTGVLNGLSADSREDVDRIVDAGLAAGGTPWREATDEGFMYGRSLADPDGNVWEVMWMDVEAATAG